MNWLLKSKLGFGITVITFLFLGIYFGNSGYLSYLNKSSCLSNLKLIKPSIDCDSLESTTEKLSSLQEKMDLMFSGLQKAGKIKRGSLFVRDLNTSRFAGVNETDTYYMASLLKVPLLVGGFKLAEVEPKVLDQEIVYNGTPNFYNDQVVKAEEVLKIGESYTIKELMKRSVIYSDNTAAQILFDYYPDEFLDRILQALGIQITRPDGETENLINARTYANVFRILYNSSYLTKEYSNEALFILTQTQFNDGATLKLPKGTLIAHKFAERTMVYQDGNVATKQFHECGIVYANKGKNPYSFCIMTEGSDYDVLESVIADISLGIYENLNNI